ncbi:sensor histidine kinase [Streptomyces sp. NPDC053069]|uniref:sensor histidine kinase n=1 Tax=Streptomyces sp. NPDC053069 TaxID=3365695 RepID=UPI0037D44C79
MLGVTLGFAEQYTPSGWPPFDTRAVVLTCVIHLPLAVRRVVPWPVLWCTCAGLAVYTALGYQPSVNVWSPMLAFFTIAAARPTRETALAALPVMGAWLHNTMASHAVSAAVALGQTLVVLLLAWGFGRNLRRLEQQNAELDRLTARLRAEEGARARHAVTEERVRIARELHDVVAHQLSVVSVQSGLARYVFDTDAAKAREALHTIEGTTREALEEMRGLLHVLRVTTDGTDAVSGPPPDPDTGLARLGELSARMVAAGLTVDTHVTGVPRQLAPGADLCAYRIVQEALTNTLKHAGPAARVRVSLVYGTGALTVTVTDDGGRREGGIGEREAPATDPGVGIGQRPPAFGQSSTGTGHGLIGMYERVRLYGGSFRAGPRPAAGFEVAFTLPAPYRAGRDGHPAAEPPADR